MRAALAIAGIAIATVVCGVTLHSQLQHGNPVVLDTSAAIPFFIEDGHGVPGYVPSDRDLAKWAFDAWSRESGGKLQFTEAKDLKSSLIRLRWISANEGLFGETQHVIVGDKTGALVFVMPEVSQLGAVSEKAVADQLLRDTIVYLTCVHEIGHAVGLPHTRKFEDIMYSFVYGGDIVAYFMRYRNNLQTRDDIPKHSGLSTSDAAVLRSLYR